MENKNFISNICLIECQVVQVKRNLEWKLKNNNDIYIKIN